MKNKNYNRREFLSLSFDIGERENVYDQHPEVVERLTKLLQKYVNDGMNTSGKVQKNDREVSILKA